MLVGDLIYNNDFDVNCNYEIYDCTEKGRTWYDSKMILGTMRDGWKKPLDKILDMKIKYITTNHQSIVIEATR